MFGATVPANCLGWSARHAQGARNVPRDDLEWVLAEPIGETNSGSVGGLAAQRGFQYQWLYSLRLIDSLIAGRIDGFAPEAREDYAAWELDALGRIRRLSLIQVKYRSRICFLRSVQGVADVLKNFGQAVRGLRRHTGAAINCTLVYNAWHDCRTNDCIERIRQVAEYAELTRKLETPSDPSGACVSFEQFLPATVSPTALLSELRFLDNIDRGTQVLELLGKCVAEGRAELLARFMEALLAIVLPVHWDEALRLESATSIPARIRDGRYYTRDSVIRVLKESVGRVIEALTDGSRQMAVEYKRARGLAREIVGQPVSAGRVRVASDLVPMTFVDVDDAIEGLTTALLAGSSTVGGLFKSGERILVRDGARTVLVQKSKISASTIHDFLLRPSCTHRDRVRLILSFARVVVSLAEAGVALLGFRSANIAYRSLYRVLEGSAGPEVQIGDIGVLYAPDPETSIVGASVVDGAVVATAIRALYFGDERARRNDLIWDDGIVADFAAHCERRGLVSCRAIAQEIALAFADEASGWPLFVSGTRKEFFRGAMAAGAVSVGTMFARLKPTHISCDRAGAEARAFYATASDGQVAFLPNSADCLTTAIRVTSYSDNRWRDNYHRDISPSTAIELAGPKGEQVRFVFVPNLAVAADVLREVYGTDIRTYEVWYRAMLRAAANLRGHRQTLPEPLQLEHDVIDRRSEKLDELARGVFECAVVEDGNQRPTNERSFRLVDPSAIALTAKGIFDRLRSQGYLPRAVERLKIEVDGHDLPGTAVGELLSLEDDQNLTPILTAVFNESRNVEIPDEGYIRFSDRGAQKVQEADQSVLRYIRYALEGGVQSEYRRAWEMIEPVLLGAPKHDAGSKLWREAFRTVRVADTDTVEGERSRTLERMRSIAEHDSASVRDCWQIIVGAPGTGKTRTVAEFVLTLLRLRDRSFPPVRVLVVGETHYAIDNWARALSQLSDGTVVAYRHLSQAQEFAGEREFKHDPEVLQWSEAAYPATAESPSDLQVQNTLEANLAAEVTVRRRELDGMLDAARAEVGVSHYEGALIPSHEWWRVELAGLRPLRVPHESEVRVGLLRLQRESVLRDVDEVDQNDVTTDSAEQGIEAQFDRPRLAYFGAPVVVSTIDALDWNAPDAYFDLVVFEEASQIRLIKLLKVLAKVLRGRGDKGLPRIILAGDPQQLAPFEEASDEPVGGVPFQAFVDGADHVQRLQIHHRMHPTIAGLVNSLFYQDETWYGRGSGTANVTWVDTSDFGVAERETGGTSLYNTGEIEAVGRVLSIIPPTEDVLVITPYSAQRARIEASFKRQGLSVRTIDGCQGIEASTVIVSFVSLSLHGKYNFVLAPRRMNVALSRASRSLWLVGSHSELRATCATPGVSEEFPHLLGLLAHFDRGGPLSGQVVTVAELPGESMLVQ